MTTLTAVGQGAEGTPVPFPAGRAMEQHERARLRAAARHARRVYPGDVGELIYRELTAYAEFGIRLSVDALIPRLATRILAMPVAGPDSTAA